MFARSSAQALLLREDAGNRINWLWVRRGCYLLITMAVVGWLWLTINDPRTLPVRKIHAVGSFVHVNEQMLREAVAKAIDGGYFRLDVDKVKLAVEKIAWIETVRVRRVWPDTLSIEVQEQVALARLAGGGLVNSRGEVFMPEASTYPEGLPVFISPGGAERKVTEHFLQARGRLSAAGLEISEFHMDARHAISLKLSNGVEVILGREAIEGRLQRLVRIYQKTLAGRTGDIARIDLRYSNGLAVGWRKASSI